MFSIYIILEKRKNYETVDIWLDLTIIKVETVDIWFDLTMIKVEAN